MVFAVTDATGGGARPVPHAGRDGLLDRRGGGQGAERRLLRQPHPVAAGRSGSGRAGRARRSPTAPSATWPIRVIPEGIDGTPPGPFSILNDGGSQPGDRPQQVGPPLPASAFQSVLGYDAFHANANFHDPFNPLNQNGVVFFPGSSAVYVNGADRRRSRRQRRRRRRGRRGDVRGHCRLRPAANVLTADQVFVRGVRLPYFNFDRNPEG